MSNRWDYLTEKFAYERRIRENKLKLVMTQEKKNNAEFIELVEKTNTDNYIQERKRKRDLTTTNQINEEPTSIQANTRKFRQRTILGQNHGENEAKVFDKQIIATIFGKKIKK